MQSIADDTRRIRFLHHRRVRSQPGTTVVTLAQFDDRYDVVYQNTPIASVPPLDLEPPRQTALLDAISPVRHRGRRRAGRLRRRVARRVTVLVTGSQPEREQEWTKGLCANSFRSRRRSTDGTRLRRKHGRRRCRLGPGVSQPVRSLTHDADEHGVQGSLGRGHQLQRPQAKPGPRAGGVDSLRGRRAPWSAQTALGHRPEQAGEDDVKIRVE